MKKSSFHEWCIENDRINLLSEWQFELNDSICSPDTVSFVSNKRVWWKCLECGNTWATPINVRTRGSGCPVCARKSVGKKIAAGKTHRGENDLATVAPQLLKEWAYEKNDISPFEISYNSNYKVWWKCIRCGNEWIASINNRVKGSRCPRCMSHYHTSYSEQAVYYYVKKEFPDAINSFSPSWLSNNMEIDIYLPSLNLGIEYDGQAYHGTKKEEKDVIKANLIQEHGVSLVRIREPNLNDINDKSFVIHTGKPKGDLLFLEEPIKELFLYIEERFQHKVHTVVDIDADYDSIVQSVHGLITTRSFGMLFPTEALLWDNEKNGSLTPYEFYPQSNVKVWWKCDQCGYEWKASIGSISHGHGCPACAGRIPQAGINDLETKHPEITKEWSSKNNKEPSAYLPNSVEKVWWKCSICGNEWKASINNRVSNGSGCPQCALKRQGKKNRENRIKERGSFASNNPELLVEWDFEKNATICEPERILSSSHIRVWWKCKKCGHEWMAFVYSRSSGRGCPSCKATNMRKNKID